MARLRCKKEKKEGGVETFGWSGLIVKRKRRRKMNVLKDQGGQWQCGI